MLADILIVAWLILAEGEVPIEAGIARWTPDLVVESPAEFSLRVHHGVSDINPVGIRERVEYSAHIRQRNTSTRLKRVNKLTIHMQPGVLCVVAWGSIDVGLDASKNESRISEWTDRAVIVISRYDPPNIRPGIRTDTRRVSLS